MARTARQQRQRRARVRRIRRFLRKRVHPLVWLVVAAGVGYGLFEAHLYTRRHPWQVALGALAVAAVAGGVWYLVHRAGKARRWPSCRRHGACLSGGMFQRRYVAHGTSIDHPGRDHHTPHDRR